MYPNKILNKKIYALCFLNAFIENICIYIIPVILSIYLTIPFTLEKFQKFILIIIILKFIEIILNAIWNTKVETFLEQNKKKLQLAYLKRINKISISDLNNMHTGTLKKEIDNIVEESRIYYNRIMMTTNGFFVAITIFLIQVFNQSITLFIICCIFIILIVIYNIIITNKNIEKQETFNKEDSKYNSIYIDFLNNIKTIKIFEAFSFTNKLLKNKQKELIEPNKKINFSYMLRSDGINALVYIMYFIILISLYFEMKQGKDIFSNLVFYTTMFTGLSVELKDVSNLFISHTKVKTANKIIEKSIKETENIEIENNWNKIELKNIEFNYYNELLESIKIPKFEIEKYQKVVITGESGQGKSTFLSLFCRHYYVSQNNYLINNQKSNKIPNIAYISQNKDMFNLSIKDNLCLGKDISTELLNKYLDDAGLTNWINNLEKGLNTIVGEKGIKMSSGQKQRLNLIRGILLDKDIYILDEPTSNLDDESENKICLMIEKYLSNKTCIIVTHRKKIINICNKQYTFKNNSMSEIDIYAN